jgi:hypothetical protein
MLRWGWSRLSVKTALALFVYGAKAKDEIFGSTPSKAAMTIVE